MVIIIKYYNSKRHVFVMIINKSYFNGNNMSYGMGNKLKLFLW